MELIKLAAAAILMKKAYINQTYLSNLINNFSGRHPGVARMLGLNLNRQNQLSYGPFWNKQNVSLADATSSVNNTGRLPYTPREQTPRAVPNTRLSQGFMDDRQLGRSPLSDR